MHAHEIKRNIPKASKFDSMQTIYIQLDAMLDFLIR